MGSEDEREWLERLARATERALGELRGRDDPTLNALIGDLEAFRRDLGRRLRGETGEPGAP